MISTSPTPTTNSGNNPLAQEVMPRVHQAVDNADALLKSTLHTAAQSAQSLQHMAQHGRDVAVTYIKNDPVKAVLIAASVGAVVALLFSALRR